MHYCPNCHYKSRLRRQVCERRVYWGCARCKGHAVGIGLFKKLVDRESFASLMGQIRKAKALGKRCAFCARPMNSVIHAGAGQVVELDCCSRCYLLWFDYGEAGSERNAVDLERLATPHPMRLSDFSTATPITESLPTDSETERQPLVIPTELGGDTLPPVTEVAQPIPYEEEGSRRGGALEADEDWFPETVPEPWQWIPAILGLPVEERRVRMEAPRITLALSAMALLISGFAFRHPQWLEMLGFHPQQPFRYGGLNLISAFFVHGGWMHLFSNLYFFNVFGDDVEEFLGGTRYLLLVVLSAVGGSLMLYALEPTDRLQIGASDAVSGVMVYYILKFPRARLMFLFFFHLVRLPAVLFLLWWVGVQILGSQSQMAGLSNVSYLSHLGGALVGFGFWLYYGVSRE